MALRLFISDALWSKIEPVLEELRHAAGSPPALGDRRMFIEAVLYQARTGTPRRDQPDEFGNWNAVYHRFRRREKRGPWKRLWRRFQTLDEERLGRSFVDSTIARAHRRAARIDECAGVSFASTGGQRHDTTEFGTVWEGVPASPAPVAIVMDEAYDGNAIRRFPAVRGIEAVIPSTANRTEPVPHDAQKYGSREKAERFFDEKLGRTFLAFVHVVSTWIGLRRFVNTA